MANLQIKGMNDNLYAKIKALAKSEKRSVSQQILFIIKEYLLKRQLVDAVKMPAQVLLEMSGSWEDERTPTEIIAELKQARKNMLLKREAF
ncbi:MAG: hypothetical protein WC248_06655 [Candidatus Methanomethylophilaceae archaeon]